MFVLVTLSTTIRIAPAQFGKDFKVAIEDEINRQYSNHVLDGEGLCICLHSVNKMSEPGVHFGDGGAHVKVEFQLIVFRPFEGEVMTGKIVQCDRSGILVGLEFFGHIFVPKDKLKPPSHFDQVWIWTWASDGQENAMYYDIGETVRVQVESISFAARKNTMPFGVLGVPNVAGVAPGVSAAAAGALDAKLMMIEDVIDNQPMRIVATMRTEGLGPTSWWD